MAGVIQVVGGTPTVPGVPQGLVCGTCEGEGLLEDEDHKPITCEVCGGTGGSDPAAVERARAFSRAYANALGITEESLAAGNRLRRFERVRAGLPAHGTGHNTWGQRGGLAETDRSDAGQPIVRPWPKQGSKKKRKRREGMDESMAPADIKMQAYAALQRAKRKGGRALTNLILSWDDAYGLALRHGLGGSDLGDIAHAMAAFRFTSPAQFDPAAGWMVESLTEAAGMPSLKGAQHISVAVLEHRGSGPRTRPDTLYAINYFIPGIKLPGWRAYWRQTAKDMRRSGGAYAVMQSRRDDVYKALQKLGLPMGATIEWQYYRLATAQELPYHRSGWVKEGSSEWEDFQGWG